MVQMQYVRCYNHLVVIWFANKIHYFVKMFYPENKYRISLPIVLLL